jgi:hypothetical protein
MLVNAVTIGADGVKGVFFIRIITGRAEEAIAYAKASTVVNPCPALVEYTFSILAQHVSLIAQGFPLPKKSVLVHR